MCASITLININIWHTSEGAVSLLYCTFAVEAESPASREKPSGTLSFLSFLSAGGAEHTATWGAAEDSTFLSGGAAGDTDAFYSNERRKSLNNILHR